jgi:hypothetical protein
MAQVGYEVDNQTTVALTGGAAKTLLMVITPASFGVLFKRLSIGFDGVTPTAVPGLVEIVRSTNATNSTPGTGNTDLTSFITQSYGRSITTGFTAFGGSTSEPTALTVIKRWLISPTSSFFAYDWPLGTEPDQGVSAGMGLRVTMPAAVNAHASIEFERI